MAGGNETLNQRVHGSSPCAPTIKINGLRKSDSSLLPKDAIGKSMGSNNGIFRAALVRPACFRPAACRTRALNLRNRLPSSRQRNWPRDWPTLSFVRLAGVSLRSFHEVT
jgi:hypothetical protein